jgi:hypothetical protein
MSHPPNVVILQFCRAILAILTPRSSDKKYVIQKKILHNFLKSGNCWENFDKFTKISLKNCIVLTNFGKSVKNGMRRTYVRKFFLPSPRSPTSLGKRLKCTSGTTSATPFYSGKQSPPSRNTQVTHLTICRFLWR